MLSLALTKVKLKLPENFGEAAKHFFFHNLS